MKKQKALFLDRDGIINIDYGYVSEIKNFKFIDGIFELLHLFTSKGYLLFIVTNQSGIGRQYYNIEDFNTLTKGMIMYFEEKSIHIEKVAYCPHAPEDNCHCRKPQTGMIDDILKCYNIDLSLSWLIGDKQSDIDLAQNSQITTSIAIGTKKITNSTYHFNSILECTTYLQKNKDKLL